MPTTPCASPCGAKGSAVLSVDLSVVPLLASLHRALRYFPHRTLLHLSLRHLAKSSTPFFRVSCETSMGTKNAVRDLIISNQRWASRCISLTQSKQNQWNRRLGKLTASDGVDSIQRSSTKLSILCHQTPIVSMCLCTVDNVKLFLVGAHR